MDDPQSTGMLVLTLKKNRSKFELIQAAMGGGGCLYPGDPFIDGPYTQFGEYTDVKTIGGTIWRRAASLREYNEPDRDITKYSICSGKTSPFMGATEVGTITYYIHKDDEALLNELDEVVKRIVVSN